MPKKNFEICDRVSLVALSLSVFLAIVTFLPGGFMPSGVLKGYIFVTAILVAFIAWLLGRLIEGTFHIPWTPILGSSAVLVVVLLFSALFSHTPYLSFFGEGFDQGTFAVLGSMVLGLFLGSMLFGTRSRVIKFLQSFFIIYVVLALFQLIHVLFPTATAMGTLFNRVDTPVGIWSDFAFISGAALIGFVMMLQFMKPSKNMKILSIVGAALSLFFVILANILMVWILIGFSAIVILIYTLIVNRFSEQRHFPFLGFALSLVALLFVLANNLIGGALANTMQASFVDVHPSLVSTLHVAGSSIRDYPVFGPGPNHFLNEWLVHRPSSVNANALWDSPFSSGSSFLLSVGVLSGGLGIIAVALFLVAFVYESFRKVFRKSNTTLPENDYFIFGLFLITLYWFLSVILFSPGMAVVSCTFIFLGVFFGLLVGEHRIAVRDINFLKDQRTSFVSILCIVALLMVSAGTVYAAAEHFGGLVYFEKGLASAQAGDLNKADSRLAQAISLTDLPLFERTRVLIAEQAIQKTLALSPNSVSSDAIKSALQNAISTGNAAALQAIALDSTDPANYLARGDLLRMLIPLKIDGALASADQAYNQAITLAPNYPKSYLDMAELYFDASDTKTARTYAQKAIDQKNNYTDAFFLMAQIETADGDSTAAINRLQDAVLIDPNNPDTHFELGLLNYQNGNYADAITSFKIAINLNSQYLNAWYYLALCDQKTGASAEATSILTALHQRLPDNQNVTNALNGVPDSSSAPAKSSTTPLPSTSSSTKQEKAKKTPIPTDTSAKVNP